MCVCFVFFGLVFLETTKTVFGFCLVPLPHLVGAAESRKRKAEGSGTAVGSVENAGEQRKAGLASLQQRKNDVVRQSVDRTVYSGVVRLRVCIFQQLLSGTAA